MEQVKDRTCHKNIEVKPCTLNSDKGKQFNLQSVLYVEVSSFPAKIRSKRLLTDNPVVRLAID